MKNQFDLKYKLDLDIDGVTFNFGLVDYSPAERPSRDCPGEAECFEFHYVINVEQQASITEMKEINKHLDWFNDDILQDSMEAEYKKQNPKEQD